MQLEENKIFANRYRLLRLLGRGGFSEVWLAEDVMTALQVALKVYAPGGGMDERGVQLFSTEFALVFNLNHSNLLKPTYYDTFERMPYLVLPYCERGSAANLVGQMREQEAWQFLRDIASGLEYLHSQEPPVIHQDIKPDNILIDDSGRYLLTDFGISIKARNTLRKSILKTEASVGTLAYMGPERFSKYPLPIKASDIFSLGATLYELLTGLVPFGEHGGLLLQHGAEIPALEGDWSDELKRLVEWCLQKETWERPSATEIRQYCEAHLNGEKPPVVPPPSLPEQEEKTPEPEVPESELSQSEPDEPVVPEPSEPVSEPEPPFDAEKSQAHPRVPAKWLKGGIALLVVVGIVVGVSRGWEKKQQEEEARAKAMEIETRYKEYRQYVHEGDSLTVLGNNSGGDDYEQFYLSAVGRYDAALRLEEEYRSDFPETWDVVSRKDTVLKKIEEVYTLFVSMAEEAEQMQDYGMAEIFYRRAAGVKPGSTLWEEFQARREAAQDSINEIKE